MEVRGWGLEGEQRKKAEEDVFYRSRQRGEKKQNMHGCSCLLSVLQANQVGHQGIRNNRNDRDGKKKQRMTERERERAISCQLDCCLI